MSKVIDTTRNIIAAASGLMMIARDMHITKSHNKAVIVLFMINFLLFINRL